MFIGIYVFVVQMRWIAGVGVLDLVTLTLVLSHQGRGGIGGWIGLVVSARCGYCLEASMTATLPPCGFPPTRE